MGDRTTMAEALGRELAEHLVDRFEPLELARGAVLLEAGLPSPWLFVLLDGTLEVRREGTEGPIAIGEIAAGTLVGEIGFVDGGAATATLVARDPCRLARIDRAVLPVLQAEAPDLAGQLLHRISTTMAGRLDEASHTVMEHSQVPEAVPGRRARVRRLLGRLMGVR